MEKKGDYGSHEKHIDQGAFKLMYNDGENVDFLFSSKDIGANLCQTLGSLSTGKAGSELASKSKVSGTSNVSQRVSGMADYSIKLIKSDAPMPPRFQGM